MRSLSKISCAIGILAAVAASAAEARSVHGAPYANAYDAYAGNSARQLSTPYDAGGPAYTAGQRGLDSSSDFQLQGR